MIDGETNTIPRYSFFKDILQDLRNMEKLAPLLMFPAQPQYEETHVFSIDHSPVFVYDILLFIDKGFQCFPKSGTLASES